MGSRTGRFLAPSLAGAILIVVCPCARPAQADPIGPDYNRHVRPILAKHCFTCHGPDEDAREADLRLDSELGSHADLGGYRAIEPGDAANSELITRVASDDDDLRMPPADSHPPLSEHDIETLRRWIDAGGDYTKHWSLVPAIRVTPPTVQDPDWCRNVIDRFVLSRLESAGMSPAPIASREALLRRVAMDLIGRPPTPEQTDQFLRDRSPTAYEHWVDRLLASPEYAERFARPWLDLARYSDTNGYEKDRERTVWPYRDWVIRAIAADMPFDEFSIQQIAGDMMPDATQQQRIATGFHRNTMLNEEGGIDPLEYRFYAMVDRVATTGTVWLGLTTGCAQCHTHKYDPITHTDYYALMALLNNADEPELSAESDAMLETRLATEQQIVDQQQRILRDLFDDATSNESIVADYQAWRQEQIRTARHWQTVRPREMKSTQPHLQLTESGSVLASGDATKRDVYTLTMPPLAGDQSLTAMRLEVLPHDSLPASGPGMAYYEGRRGDFFLSKLTVKVNDKPIPLDRASSSYGKISVGSGSADAANVLDDDNSTGWSTSGQTGKANQLVVHFAEPLRVDGPWTVELLFERHFVAALGHFRVDVTTDPRGAAAKSIASDLESALVSTNSASHERTADVDPNRTERQLRLHYLLTSDKTRSHRKPIEALRASIPPSVRTLVMRQRPPENPRTTRRHHRGEYLQPKEIVDGGVPVVFSSDSRSDPPTNRLELARWLVGEQNPLVGRVVVNRAWREFFGTGIVRTDGDFGTQSEPPSHPELLDWLDQDLRAHGWSLKRLHRQIVTSATYRQQAAAPPDTDPDNRLLSTFGHRRYDAERIRDAMLAAANLLEHRVGGPSVHPPQPPQVQQLSYGRPKWPTSEGGNRYRRSLYTFSKRTAPFAAYTTFDAPTGELCIARRQRSTTPLQALTLLNDQMYLEIAGEFARDVLRDANAAKQNSPQQIVDRMFRRLLVRHPEPWERERIIKFYEQQQDSNDAWMLVARAMMNLDEAITTP